VLTAGQDKAKAEILAAMAKGHHHVLRGFAGTGKTTLMRVVVREMLEAGKHVAVCAPTNKAVSVLERNMRAAAIEAPCLTIYKLLGVTPGSDHEKRKPKRVGKNKALHYNVVILDECSMVSSDLMERINKDLGRHFVLYVGDPAQLPPVGEKLSETLATPSCSMLSEIMRQAADNPVIALATDIRKMIETATADWGRFAPVDAGGDFGIFCPGIDAQAWVDDAFTSAEFRADNDRFRYLCWTNKRVREVNSRIRKLIYGDTPTPFVVGERVLVRSNITTGGRDGEVTINTNDEAVVEHIAKGTWIHKFVTHVGGTYADGRRYAELPARTIEMQVWDVVLKTRDDKEVETRIALDDQEYKAICDELVGEARRNKARWFEYFDFTDSIARLQSVYAMTVHCSQGSTFENVIVDVDDCARNSRTVEMLQLLYVACTRPQKALVLV
jgi:exodeoxyribonuclease-5